MKTHKPLNAIVLLTAFVGFYALTGCGMKTSSSSGNSGDGLRAQAWAPSATPLDTGSVFDETPQIAVEPDGGGTAIAVWLKFEDPDPFDGNPQQVYRLYAANYNGTTWGSPQVIDAGSANYYNAWSPKVSMDNNGDAIVVWQQHDGTAQRVYARRFSGGSWGAIQQLNNSAEFTNYDAADPAIALEPDPTNNGAPDDAVGSAMAAWSQYSVKDWVQVFNSDSPAGPGVDCVGAAFNNCASVQAMAVYNGQLFAGLGGLLDGSADVYVFDQNSGWSISFNDVNVGTNDDQPDFVTAAMTAYNGKLYVGVADLHGIHFFAQLRIYDGSTWTIQAVDFGVYTGVDSMAVYNGQLYIGMGSNNGAGDVLRCTLCDGTDWVTVLNHPTGTYEAVTAMAVYNNQLYIGLGTSVDTDADVKRCTICDGTDWALVLDNGAPYDSVRSMAVHNGQLYVGLGDNPGDGDIMRCTVCGGADWTTVFTTASYESVRSMVSYNGLLYIGLGAPDLLAAGTAGNGDIMRCIVCDNTDWTYSRNDGVAPFTPATYEAVPSLAVYNGELYAGFGTDILADADIWKFSAGWQTVARRLVNGVWDTTDTVCPAGSGLDDGICYVSGVGGTSLQPSEGPRVGMDNFGRTVAAFVQHVLQNNCTFNADQNIYTDDPLTSCTDSELHANLFNASWQGTIDLDPGVNSVDQTINPRRLVCFQNSTATNTARGNGSGSTDACVNVIEFDLAMNGSGQAALLIKTAWKENEDWGTNPDPQGGCDNTHRVNGSSCTPDGNAFEDYMGQAIVARQYTMGAAWATGSWTLNRLANFGYAAGTSFGEAIGPFPAGCPSSTTIDGGRVTLNCHLTNPRIALSPGGTTAIAVYESYDGTSYDIQAHQYNGAAWGAFATVDVGGGDAHAPQIAMDNSGDGTAVWTQNDGSIFRIYSNCFATGVGTCGGGAGWQGAVLIDGNVGSESGYFNPVVGLAAPGGANSALSLFLGWSVADNTTRLYYATGP